MLQRLHIQNYAIIQELSIDFSGRLNIITGETGAGKSILLGALDLILGGRADSSVLQDKSRKCVVEGIFSVAGRREVSAFMEENDLDVLDEVVLRREISPPGKSRSFINDTPVNLAQLSRLSSLLVDLHQQFDTLELGESEFQRKVLDALAGHTDLLREYHGIYASWQEASRELEGLQAQKLQFEREADYNRFQFQELEDAGLRPQELEELDAELKRLESSEGIQAALTRIHHELRENETPIVQQLRVLVQQLQPYAEYHPDLPELLSRLHAAQVELLDLAGEAQRIADHVQYDPRRIDQIHERLSLGYRLLKKHGVKTTDELLAIHRQLADRLRSVLEIDDRLAELGSRSQALRQQAETLAGRLTRGRQAKIRGLEDQVNALLVRVGMPNARLKAEINPGPLGPSGADQVEFLFNANLPAGARAQGAPFLPVRKVASGGELSRLMLCIKSLVAQSIDLPTLIFDEIDTGISGEAARQVGIIMKGLAASRQVICITHQPQLAGKADAHFFVYKETRQGTVRTGIRLLDAEERVQAIARMLGGEKPTAAAIQNAREMVND